VACEGGISFTRGDEKVNCDGLDGSDGTIKDWLAGANDGIDEDRTGEDGLDLGLDLGLDVRLDARPPFFSRAFCTRRSSKRTASRTWCERSCEACDCRMKISATRNTCTNLSCTNRSKISPPDTS
jgi:hypothetical protein